MTPEYIEELAQRADPDELWRLAGMDQLELPAEKRKQLDTAVALRRYAHLLRDVDRAAQEGKSWLITRLGPSSTAVRSIKTPPDHQRSRELSEAAHGVAVPPAHHHEAWWLIEATAPPRPLYYTGPCRHPTAYRIIVGTTGDAGKAVRYPTEEAAKLTVALMLGIDTTEPTWPLRVVNSGWKVTEHIFDYTPSGVMASDGSKPE